jgi:hypothetical protein
MIYFDGQKVKKGDTFVVARWGTCMVIGFDRLNKSVTAKNLCTGELFDMLGKDTFSQADLIKRLKN